MWTPVLTGDGSWTLRSDALGATCHSTAGAWTQACARYAAPCRIAELAQQLEVVRVLDVGTGVGLNLAAALAAADGGRARLVVTSLELRADVVRAAFELGPWPDSCASWAALAQRALAAAIDAGPANEVEFEGGRGSLRLRLGDARETIVEFEGERFDAVFLDPFAPREDPALWTAAFLRSVARGMAPAAILSTYSASLDVRIALATAGLRVGRGPRVGRKAEGTLASFASPLPALAARAARRVLRRVGGLPPLGLADPPGPI